MVICFYLVLIFSKSVFSSILFSNLLVQSVVWLNSVLASIFPTCSLRKPRFTFFPGVASDRFAFLPSFFFRLVAAASRYSPLLLDLPFFFTLTCGRRKSAIIRHATLPELYRRKSQNGRLAAAANQGKKMDSGCGRAHVARGSSGPLRRRAPG